MRKHPGGFAPVKNFTPDQGFTLAEMLIVVAIIAVLVAVSVPVLNRQIERSRQATDFADLRNAYAAAKIAEINGEIAAFDADGNSINPIRIGDSLDGSDTSHYSAAASVFLYDADAGKLIPWADSTTIAPGANPVTVNTDDSSVVTTKMKAQKPSIVLDAANLPGGNAGLTRYGYRVSDTEYKNDALPGKDKRAWKDMKIVVQFTLEGGVWGLKSTSAIPAIRYENVGTYTDITPIVIK